MREGWDERRLGDVCDLRAGEYIPKERYDDGPYFIYGSNSVMGRVTTPLIEHPHVVMAAVGANAGAVRFSPEPSWVNNNAFALIARPGVEPQFLYFWLEAVLRKASVLAGTGQPYVKKGLLRDQKVALPPLDEQRRIVDLIGSLDATITATDQAVAKAEQARRAVLTDLLSLTPSSAQSAIADASKRPPIARGWSRVTIGQVADAQRGYSYSSPELSAEPTGFGLVALKTVGKNGGFQRQGMRFLRSAARSPATVGPGDLLVAATDLTRAREVLGSSILVPQGLPPESVFSLDMVKLVPNPQVVMTEFLDCFLQAPHTRRVVKSLGTGTTVVHLNVAAFLALPVLLPPLDEQRRIVDMVSTLHNEVVALKATAKAARSARAGILSELLSGSHEIPASYDRLLEAT